MCRVSALPIADRAEPIFKEIQRNKRSAKAKQWSSKRSQLAVTNRFDVAVRLFSNRLQMKSKCGNNKEVAHES